VIYLAPSAVIAGDVAIRAGASVWHNAVLRGDLDAVVVGAHTSIQDNATVHVDEGLPVGIGERVTVGHSAVVHACRIGDDCLLGMNCVVLSGAAVGAGSIVAAGAVVPENETLPGGSIYGGVPARRLGPVTEIHRRRIDLSWRVYEALAGKSLPPAEEIAPRPDLRVRVGLAGEFTRSLREPPGP
jgi:carbonic anhydrase/acetyltransferase-like protein (isoleucine patch superfamily)